MKLTRLLVLVISCISPLVGMAQAPKTGQPTELDAVIKELETKGYEGVKDKKVSLRAIHYISGTSRLAPEDKLYLDTVAVFLTRVPTVVMEIGGHSDNVGDRNANTKLSQERATSAMQYVVSRGVLPGRIKAVGYGSTQPIAENKTEVGRAQNRRVELRFLGLTSDVYNIVTKSGRKIPSTYVVISADGRSVSYRESAGSPLTRVPTSGIDYIEYPDGSRRRPDAIVLSGNSGGGSQTTTTVVEEVSPPPVTSRSSLTTFRAANAHSIIKYAPLSSFGYEHVLANNHSIYGGVSLYSLGFGASAIGLKGEYRFYGLIKTSPKQAPEGFWVAPTVLLWRVTVSDFIDTESVFVAQVGAIAGYQWIFNNKISLEPALGLSLTALGTDSDTSLGAGVVPLFALRVGYVIK